MEDLTIQCRDCPEQFVVTRAEQKSLIARFGDKYTPPKRCKPCRKKRQPVRMETA